MKKYLRNNETISGKLHDEQVMMDIGKGKYFSLNPVATRMWEILEQPKELTELCLKLTEEYDIEMEQCKKDTNEHLKQMIKMGLIHEVD